MMNRIKGSVGLGLFLMLVIEVGLYYGLGYHLSMEQQLAVFGIIAVATFFWLTKQENKLRPPQQDGK